MSVRFQHYEVPQRPDGTPWELGRGAMGVTYKAFDTNLRSPAALKVINPQFLQDERARQRFLREARAAAQLRHPNVATIYHLGHEGVENYFYAMELIEGETFEQLIVREGPLAPALALELTLQVTRALIAAHAVGLIHRDIKPSNLMIMRHHGEILVKVIDFGLAKAVEKELEPVDGSALGNALTRTSGGGFLGTPYYASPEQLEGLPVDTRSDIYSLGVTLWFLLSGKPPFHATSMARVISEHLGKPPPFEVLPPLPEKVTKLLRRMLHKEAHERQQTPVELRDEILACLRALPSADEAAEDLASTLPMPAEEKPASPEFDGSQTDLATTCEVGTLAVGTVLGGGLRLDQRLGTNTFVAADPAGQDWIVRLIPRNLIEGLRPRLAGWQAAARKDPALLYPQSMGVAPDGSGYVVLEGVNGGTLLDVMREQGALSLGEALDVLEPLAAAHTALRAEGWEGVHLDPAHIRMPEPTPEGTPGGPPRVLPADLFEAVEHDVDETVLSESAAAGVPSLVSGADPRSFGRLLCELLGGPTRNWLEPNASRYTPLSSLNESGNVALRRCLCAPKDEGGGYLNPSDFVTDLRKSVVGTALAHAPKRALGSGTSFSGALPKSEPAVGAGEDAPAGSSRFPLLGLAAAAAAILLALFFWPRGGPEKNATGSAARQRPTVAPKLEAMPLVVGQPWTNSLGMKFVPSENGTAHAAIWPVRLRDFTAFFEATKYDAIGGMFAVNDLGTRGPNARRSWKDPGFEQTPEHPVVGVNATDAEAFCAWLTKKEREAGLLPVGRRYRLPTDAEWNAFVGYTETAAADATPEQRGKSAPNTFSWGTAWPPPPDVANLAGSEAKLPPDSTLVGYRDRFERTAPVGSFQPSASGLYDLTGNVWQWSSDRYNAESNWRVLRGGSWLTSDAQLLRIGARHGLSPSFRHDDVGFRCVIATDP
ncbi:MAG: SUMF1/EgtB/PvdO family nonheme iron enzyme [Verrucomicrobia bacterium]|nr:SUMF1/EgtB/PvdO family nonheme iron enzyme [Verrucomicrobiota bacterium]